MKKSGASIHEFRANGVNNQIWVFAAVADGSYAIQNADSGFFLAAASIKGNWILTQQKAPAAGPQTWRIESQPWGSRIVNQQSGMLLANVDYFTSEGMGVALARPLEIGRAEWTLQPAIPRAAGAAAIP